MSILVHRQGNNFGPFSVDQANALLREGRLALTDLAWVEGTPEWVPLSRLPGIVVVPPPLPHAVPQPVHPETTGYPLAAGEQGSPRVILVAFLLAFLVGVFGIHRFYVGKVGSGIAMLVLTLSVIGVVVTGIWCLVDWIVILCGGFRDAEERRLTRWV